MLRCSEGVGVVLALALLCRAGLCANRIIPESGGIIAGVLGTQNISLYCDLRNEQGDRLIVNWFIQSRQSREDGNMPGSIRGDDDRFIQSGDIFETIQGNLTLTSNLNTNLTILSLTDDLDEAIIFCGFDRPDIANFTLRIYRPPVLVDRGEETRRENEGLILDLSDPASPPAFPFPSQFMWSRQDGVELVNVTDTRVFSYPSIDIGSVLPSDTGLYTLTATNYQLDGVTPVGSDTASFNLNVLFGAGLGGDGSGTVAVLEGETATLVCGTDLTGNPLPNITWTDNNDSEVTSGGRFTVSGGRDVVSLTLDSSERGDAGNWTCTAQVYETGSLTVGGPVERSVQLVVVVAPSTPEELHIEQIGGTWISLSWSHNENNSGIPSFSRVVIVVTEGGVERNVTVESRSTTVNVTGLLPGTNYMLRVVAVSVFGGVQAPSLPSLPINATTGTTVPSVVCTDQPAVNNTDLVVTWSYVHTGGLKLTHMSVEYRNETSAVFMTLSSYMSGSGFVGTTSGHRVSTNENSVSLPLPFAGVEYFFRVTATNEEGSTTADCPSILLTTGIPMVPNKPELMMPRSSTEVNITLSTNYSGVHDPIEDNFHFILHIENSTDSSVTEDVHIAVVCPEGGEECSTFHVISLTTHSYNISASSMNRYGRSGPSTTLPIPDLVPIIIASIGGGLSLVVAIILLLVALCILRGRNSGRYIIGNNKRGFTPPTITDPIQCTPPNSSHISLHISLSEPQGAVHDNSDEGALATATDKHTTFHSPKRETEPVCPAEQCDDDSVNGETDEPVNDSVTYQAMNGPSDDDSYEEIIGALYDVPRLTSPAACDTFDNSAYNVTSFDNPVYINVTRHRAAV